MDSVGVRPSGMKEVSKVGRSQKKKTPKKKQTKRKRERVNTREDRTEGKGKSRPLSSPIGFSAMFVACRFRSSRLFIFPANQHPGFLLIGRDHFSIRLMSCLSIFQYLSIQHSYELQDHLQSVPDQSESSTTPYYSDYTSSIPQYSQSTATRVFFQPMYVPSFQLGAQSISIETFTWIRKPRLPYPSVDPLESTVVKFFQTD